MSDSTQPTVYARLVAAPEATCESLAAVLDTYLAHTDEPPDGEVLAHGYSANETREAILIVAADTIADARELLQAFPVSPRVSER